MPATTTAPAPTRRLANAAIAILIVCSIGAAIEGTGCVNVRYSSCRLFAEFFSHLPFYVLGAVALSELLYWGIFGRLRVAKENLARDVERRKKASVSGRKILEGLFITMLTVGVVSIYIWLNA